MNSLFLSTYQNKVDKKSRVSVPSSFREILLQNGFNSMIIFKSISKQCLEVSDIKYIAQLNDAISKLDPFSEEKDAFATSIFSESMELEFDSEGRITIPRQYLEYGNIDENAIFIGKGKTFEIWNPMLFSEYSKKCKEFAINNTKVLKWS